MSTRYALERDLDELERMTERLQEYLLGDQLYLSIGAGFLRGGSMPQMTLGALLLRRRRLSALRARLRYGADGPAGGGAAWSMTISSASGLCITRKSCGKKRRRASN